MGCGLLHSYSRGAWCGTACGFLFLMWLFLCRGQGERKGAERRLHLPGRPKGNVLIISVILSSIVLLSYWHFRRTDWRLAHRAFSAVNSADFSWRNRVAAWEGALQITAEHPGFGTGWNQPEPLFEHFYLPPKLTESAAIEMNDYLMLGAAIGIPALFCFGMYLWLSLTGKGGAQRGRGTDALHQEKTPAEIEDKTLISEVTVTSTRASETQTAYATVGWLQTTCRAGAVVLLVGFWFDGGLFNLATVSTFWILLELGNVCQYEAHEMRENG